MQEIARGFQLMPISLLYTIIFLLFVNTSEIGGT
uniref:Uncharacterized protein n=1 Tax=Nelumbo nucifera TaxID=4432 RepID=A0A822Z024_NELNU|nr:TPA_asm: hypothetical protein HUJ06_014027 [Nelumbo nucifera]